MVERKTRTVSIALLVADTPPPSVVDKRGRYPQIYNAWLQKSLASIPRHGWMDKIEVELTPFDVVNEGKYPDEGMLRDGIFDAIMVTGSASSAYLDLPWANRLAEYIANVKENHPLVRIIGICYGHQIVARALRAHVELNEKGGWEVGSYECDLTEEGREMLGYGEEEAVLRIQECHRDHVTEVPRGCELLASTSKSPIQGFALRYPTEAPPLPSTAGTSEYTAFDISDFGTDSSGPMPARSAQVMTLQGHPEFDEEIVTALIFAKTEVSLSLWRSCDVRAHSSQICLFLLCALHRWVS